MTVTERTASEQDQRAAVQQRDNLCGPFHIARVLREFGFADCDGEPIDQDLVALRAGTLLPAREEGPQVPPGAINLRDYRYPLATAAQAQSGTGAEALADAVAELSGGQLACVALRSSSWTAPDVSRLIDGARSADARLIANLRTGRLWGSRPPIEALLAQLDGRQVRDPPAADWDVGHFVELVSAIRGPGGELVLVADSYPSLGWGGRYLQPPAAVAAALDRGDGRGGGVLAIGRREQASAIRGLAGSPPLEIGIWQN